MGTLFDRLLQEIEHPNPTTNPSILALPYVPTFVIHTVLFSLKVYKYATSDRFQRSSSLLAGFLKEYVSVCGASLHQILILSSGV